MFNFGESGQAVSRHSKDRSYWITESYRLSLLSRPHIVVLQFGHNDAIKKIWNEEKFIKDYGDMIEIYRGLPSNPTVYVCIPPPYYVFDTKNKLARTINQVMPPVLRQIAHLHNVRIIDLFKALDGRGFSMSDAFSPDMMHPSDLGYVRIAHEVAWVLSQYEDFPLIKYHEDRVEREK